jgi:hypothetical protein
MNYVGQPDMGIVDNKENPLETYFVVDAVRPSDAGQVVKPVILSRDESLTGKLVPLTPRAGAEGGKHDRRYTFHPYRPGWERRAHLIWSVPRRRRNKRKHAENGNTAVDHGAWMQDYAERMAVWAAEILAEEEGADFGRAHLLSDWLPCAKVTTEGCWARVEQSLNGAVFTGVMDMTWSEDEILAGNIAFEDGGEKLYVRMSLVQQGSKYKIFFLSVSEYYYHDASSNAYWNLEEWLCDYRRYIDKGEIPHHVKATLWNRLMHALNGNITRSICVHTDQATASTTQRNIALYVAGGTERVTNVSLQGMVWTSSTGISTTWVVQTSTSGPSAINVVGGEPIGSFITVIAHSFSGVTPVVNHVECDYSMAAGEVIYLSALSDSTSSSVGWVMSVCVNGDPDPAKVDVVGFAAQNAPLWTSIVKQGEAVVVPSPRPPPMPIMAELDVRVSREEWNRLMHAMHGNTTTQVYVSLLYQAAAASQLDHLIIDALATDVWIEEITVAGFSFTTTTPLALSITNIFQTGLSPVTYYGTGIVDWIWSAGVGVFAGFTAGMTHNDQYPVSYSAHPNLLLPAGNKMWLSYWSGTATDDSNSQTSAFITVKLRSAASTMTSVENEPSVTGIVNPVTVSQIQTTSSVSVDAFTTSDPVTIQGGAGAPVSTSLDAVTTSDPVTVTGSGSGSSLSVSVDGFAEQAAPLWVSELSANAPPIPGPYEVKVIGGKRPPVEGRLKLEYHRKGAEVFIARMHIAHIRIPRDPWMPLEVSWKPEVNKPYDWPALEAEMLRCFYNKWAEGKTYWKRDLTMDGDVESNPGPEPMDVMEAWYWKEKEKEKEEEEGVEELLRCDDGMLIEEVKKKDPIAGGWLSACLGARYNYYAPLTFTEEEISGVKANVGLKSSKPGERKGDRRTKSSGAGEVSRIRQKQVVVTRICTKLRGSGGGIKHTALAAWLDAGPDASWIDQVMVVLVGAQWWRSEDWLVAQASLISASFKLPKKAFVAWKMAHSLHLDHSYAFTTWLKSSYPGVSETDLYAEELSLFERKESALSGGRAKDKVDLTVCGDVESHPGPFSGTMKNVREAKAFAAFYKAVRSMDRVKPWNLALTLATTLSSANPVDVTAANGMPLFGDTVSSLNTVTNGVALNAPEGLLIARQVRSASGAGALTASTNRLNGFCIGAMTFKGSTLVGTELLSTITDAAIKANQNLGRADNTTLGGFNAFDVAYIGRLKSYSGLSMQSAILKLVLLSQVANWLQSPETLPMSCPLTLNDPYTIVSDTPNIVVSYNDSAIYSEACGGETAVLPFRGGETGMLYFHLTLATVPDDARSLAIFIPANLVNSTIDPGLAYYLFTQMWSDWPTLMYTVSMDTTDSTGANGATQQSIPTSCGLFFPGQTEIHLVIPRNTTVRNPTNQNDANTYAWAQPTTGPTASTGLAAGAAINVNYVGGGLQGVNLAEYCYTWGNEANMTTINQFLQRLNDVVNISDELKCAYQQVAAWSVRYPAMYVNAPVIGGNLAWAPNNALLYANYSPLGPRAVTWPAAWPQSQIPRPDFLAYATDVVAWNKTCLTVALPEGTQADGGPIPSEICNPKALFWSIFTARAFAITTTVHRANIGLGAKTWDSAWLVSDMLSFRNLVRWHYASTSHGDLTPSPAKMGSALASLYTGMFGGSPSPDLSGNTVFDYVCPPRMSINNCWDGTGTTMENIIPVLIADVWVHQMTRDLPKALMSFPPQNNQDSTTGLVDGSMSTVILASSYYGPMTKQTYQRSALRQNETCDYSDDEMWNMRLMVPLVNFTIRGLTGTPLASAPAPGQIPLQRWQKPDSSFTTLAQGGIVNGSTFWIPKAILSGQLVWPTADRNSMIPVNKVMLGISRAAIAIWAINGPIALGDLKLGVDMDKMESMWQSIAGTGEGKPEAGPSSASGEEET